MPDPVDAEPRAVRTQFRDYYAFGERHVPAERKEGVSHASYTTRFYDKLGKPLGLMRYYDDPKVVTWSFSNGQEGVAPEWRVPEGYKFDPNMAWAGIQAMVFQQTRHADGSKVIKSTGNVNASYWS